LLAAFCSSNLHRNRRHATSSGIKLLDFGVSYQSISLQSKYENQLIEPVAESFIIEH
jgi:hypothetical protein